MPNAAMMGCTYVNPAGFQCARPCPSKYPCPFRNMQLLELATQGRWQEAINITPNRNIKDWMELWEREPEDMADNERRPCPKCGQAVEPWQLSEHTCEKSCRGRDLYQVLEKVLATSAAEDCYQLLMFALSDQQEHSWNDDRTQEYLGFEDSSGLHLKWSGDGSKVEVSWE